MRFIDINFHIILHRNGKLATIKLTAMFEDVINNGFPTTIELRDRVSIELSQLTEIFDEVDRITNEHPFFKLKLCESPIELKFFVYAMYKVPNLKPQVEVEPYWVDLAIPEKKVAIELDGHEFHKTREQRTDDAKRERYLQRQGWTVIRFTGSEIHKDVSGCIDEAIELIAKQPTLSTRW